MKLTLLGDNLKPLADYIQIEVGSYKWPKRAQARAWARELSSDQWGHWLGIGRGEPWHSADGHHSGIFERSFVKLVPPNRYWSACFNLTGNLVDVDMIVPVSWKGNILEEIDLELDILQHETGTIHVRDQDAWEQIKPTLSTEMIQQVEQTCSHIQTLLHQGAEPFGSIGKARLLQWITLWEQD